MKHILDKAFKWVPSFDTNVLKTFERVKAEQERAKAAKEQVLARTRIKAKIS